jgi:hypothetical protein
MWRREYIRTCVLKHGGGAARSLMDSMDAACFEG